MSFTSNANFDMGNFVRSQLVNGHLYNSNTPGVTFPEFQDGQFHLSFNLAASTYDGLIFPTTKNGFSSLKIEFNRPIPQNLQAIVYSEFPSMLTLSAGGGVSTSYRT